MQTKSHRNALPARHTMQQFREFLPKFVADSESDAPFKRQFYNRTMTVYMRRQWDHVGDEFHVCLALANVHVRLPRRGIFSSVLKTVQDFCPWNAVKVEFVENPHLQEYLQRLAADDPHWVEVPSLGSPSFFWMKDPAGEYRATYHLRLISRAERKMIEADPSWEGPEVKELEERYGRRAPTLRDAARWLRLQRTDSGLSA